MSTDLSTTTTVTAGKGVTRVLTPKRNIEQLWISPHSLDIWAGNPPRRRERPGTDIRQSLAQYGWLAALTGVRRRGKIIIVDGNRRLRVAQDLGLPEVPINVVDIPPSLSPDKVAVLLNTVGTKWNARDLVQMFAKYEGSLDVMPSRQAGPLQGIRDLLGEAQFKYWFATQSNSPSVWKSSVSFMLAINSTNRYFHKRLLLWALQHKQILLLKEAAQRKSTPQLQEIVRAVKENRPARILG